MPDTLILTLASSLVATLFGILVLILGWLGARIHLKLDNLADVLQKALDDVHDRITGVDKRVTAIETRCAIESHLRQQGKDNA